MSSGRKTRSQTAVAEKDENILAHLAVIKAIHTPEIFDILHDHSYVISQCNRQRLRCTYKIIIIKASTYCRHQSGEQILFELIRSPPQNNLANRKFFIVKARVDHVKIRRSYEHINLNCNEQSTFVLNEDVIVTHTPAREFTFRDQQKIAAKSKVAEVIHNRFMRLAGSRQKKGLTATVVIATDTFMPNGTFALKRFDFSKINAHTTSTDEIDVMRRLGKHGNIVTMIEVIESPRERTIVLEKMDGNLVELLNSSSRRTSGGLAEVDVIVAIKQLLSAFAYVHSKKISHNDVKLDNMLYKKFDGDAIVYKICDFGSARIHDNLHRLYDYMCYTAKYASPEVLKANKAKNSTDTFDRMKSDLFSFGVVIHLLATGSHPFKSNSDHMKAISLPTVEFLRLSEELRSFMNSLLKFNPNARPTARDALKHRLFETDNFMQHECTINTQLNVVDLSPARGVKKISAIVSRRSSRIADKLSLMKRKMEKIPLVCRRNRVRAMVSAGNVKKRHRAD